MLPLLVLPLLLLPLLTEGIAASGSATGPAPKEVLEDVAEASPSAPEGVIEVALVEAHLGAAAPGRPAPGPTASAGAANAPGPAAEATLRIVLLALLLV